jgi:hypothetical protein
MIMAVPRPAEELFSFERLERASDDDRYEPTEKDEFAPPSEGIKGEIVHVSARHLTKDIRIPGVRIRDKVTYYDDGSVASPQRDPAWVTIVTAFHDEISAKRKRFDDFWSFVERHPLANHIGPWLGRAERRAKTRDGKRKRD